MSHYSSSTSSSTMSSTTTRRGAGRLSTRTHSQARRPQRDLTDDILSLVDQHLAWQAESSAREQARRGSAGTLIVDWDGVGEGRAFYRGHRESSSSSSSACSEDSSTDSSQYQHASSASTSRTSLLTSHHQNWHARRDSTPSLTVQYSPAKNVASGFDSQSYLGYAYNGQTLRVRRPSYFPPSHSPQTQKNFVPVEHYTASAPLHVLPTNKALPATPVQDKKRQKILGFVHKVMHKLDRIGVMGKMRQEKEGRRRKEMCVRKGYVV